MQRPESFLAEEQTGNLSAKPWCWEADAELKKSRKEISKQHPPVQRPESFLAEEQTGNYSAKPWCWEADAELK